MTLRGLRIIFYFLFIDLIKYRKGINFVYFDLFLFAILLKVFFRF